MKVSGLAASPWMDQPSKCQRFRKHSELESGPTAELLEENRYKLRRTVCTGITRAPGCARSNEFETELVGSRGTFSEIDSSANIPVSAV
jgi:hypothetical protein